jgi:hypothetical protein
VGGQELHRAGKVLVGGGDAARDRQEHFIEVIQRETDARTSRP